ncbi:MAG: M16 family metallopeptidase [Thermodesulfobacteriota bacterium]
MIEKTVLDNGVRIISERNPQAFSVTVGLWMEVGSRDEDPAQGGVSHFIEHMAFKGTARRSPLDIAREIDRLGGLANAFTSKEHTCFHARALANRLPDICDLLCDLLLHPALDPAELERERDVILQEISAVEDTPDELVHVLFSQNYWPAHPLGRPVLGSAESVAALDRAGIKGYLGANYLPPRMVAAAVGNLEHGQVVDLIGPALAALPAGPPAAPRCAPSPRPGLWLAQRDSEQVHLALGLPAPAAGDPDRFSAALLNLILGGNMSSRLFQEVREKRGLAYAVYSYLSSYTDCGLLGIYLGVAPERTAEALDVVRQELARLAAEPPQEHELLDAKENLTGAILLAAENPESRMSRIARNEYQFGREISPAEAAAMVEKVGLDDIADLAQRLLAADRLGVMALGPLEPGALGAELAA